MDRFCVVVHHLLITLSQFLSTVHGKSWRRTHCTTLLSRCVLRKLHVKETFEAFLEGVKFAALSVGIKVLLLWSSLGLERLLYCFLESVSTDGEFSAAVKRSGFAILGVILQDVVQG